ncbi:hypothetical protein GCM10010104_71140 [Streptomyces indiaensis]|uniref:Tc1-like transposase DDE domain-containing protein n=1 Tax=Streptomyces indiaensis TaxID=284033 RepID=A0ABP5RNA4_9ACTN
MVHSGKPSGSSLRRGLLEWSGINGCLAQRGHKFRPIAGSCWAPRSNPDQLPVTYRRTHGITYFHGCYSVGDDRLWGVIRRRKGIDHTWAALRSIHAAHSDGAPIYVILDNLSAHLNRRIRRWADRGKVELCFTPTYASWANPIEAHFGPLRQFNPRQLEPPQPHRPDPRPACLPALAQRERPPPGRPRRPTTRTRASVARKHIRWGGRSLQLAA